MPLSQDFGIIDQITHVDRIDLTEFLVDKISTDRWSPFDQIQIFRRENDDIDIAVQLAQFFDRDLIDGHAFAAVFFQMNIDPQVRSIFLKISFDVRFAFSFSDDLVFFAMPVAFS